MQFHYKAIKKNGEPYEGTLDAEDKFALARQLRSQGEMLVSASSGKKKMSKNSFKEWAEKIGTVSMDEKINFARNLSAMLTAGLSLGRALSVLERQAHNPRFKKVLRDVQDSVNEGKAFNEALIQYPKVFSPLFIAMVRAGEESGGLSDALGVVAIQMHRAHTLKKKIRGAMTYPAIIVCVMVVIAILMLIFIVPTLTETFREVDVELPATTQLVIFISDLFKDHLILMVVGMLAFVGGMIGLYKKPKTRRGFEFVFLHFPLIGTLVRETNAARTARTLSSLLSSGVDVVQAMSITKDVVQNSYFKDVLGQAEEAIPKGVTMSSVFIEHEELFPVLVGEMMSVGEETGKLSEMLTNLASFYEEEVDRKTKDMSTIIEPFLMVFIGAAVGFFALAMISPIYSLTDAI
ncbi:MAG: type II secretion system F family protein [Candidatus Paceibacterota bacterium]